MNIEESPLIFIYYNCKGPGQPVRNLLCYLELPFIEVLYDRLQEQEHQLPKDVIKQVRSLSIDVEKLPIIMNGSIIVQGLGSTMAFLCKKANRMELCGADIKTRAKVEELMQVILKKQSIVLEQAKKYISYSSQCEKDDLNQYSKQIFESMMNKTKFIRIFCQYLDQQKDPKFIFQTITFMDFMAFDIFTSVLGFFDHDERIYKEILEKCQPNQMNPLSKPNVYYISVMKSHRDRMLAMDFYQKHKTYLQSFSMFPIQLGMQQLKGFKKLWIGDPNCKI